MKRIITFFMIACMTIGLWGCKEKEPAPDRTTPESTEEDLISEDSSETEDTSGDAEETEEIKLLRLEKRLVTNYDWHEDTPVMLAYSAYSPVTMHEEDAKTYPQMAQTLEELSRLQTNSMEDEYENLVSFAKEALSEDETHFSTQRSTLDIQVRRADSVAVSLLADSYLDSTMVSNVYGKFGYNFDTATGRELQITDVIPDMSQIPELIDAQLDSKIIAEELYSDTAVEDYFKDTQVSDIAWTLDYNGVTFYFAAGTLAEAEYGAMTAHLPFAGNEALFAEKYRKVPDAYMVRLSMNHTFFTQLDDGACEELFVSGNYDTEGRFYSDFEVFVGQDARYQEEYYAYDFRPYYVKTADEHHYLYLFADGTESHHRKMTLVVMDLNDGCITKAGECYMGPYYRQEPDTLADIFYIPTDPNRLYLDDFGDGFWEDQIVDGIYTGDAPEAYRIEESSGIPVLPEETEGETSSVTISSVEELLEEIKPGASVVLKPGHYDLSETIEELWLTQGEEWNENHTYVQLEECFDGIQLVICGADNLTICGGSENTAYTEVVTRPRYATVFTFRDCENVILGNLTLGHTETGRCEGNVLDFYGCRNISMSAMDLYGCGYYGIGAFKGTGELYVYSSTIRDCSGGSMNIYEADGKLEFHNCWFENNGVWCNYEASGTSTLSFYECCFGSAERDYLMYHPDVSTRDCTWEAGEEVLPEYGWDVEPEMEFDEELMRGIELKPELPTYTTWYAYQMTDAETGEKECYPIPDPETEEMISLYMEFQEDGTGWIQEGEEYLEFTWYCLDDVMTCIEAENGEAMSVEFYRQEGASPETDMIWMRLVKDDKIIWLY